MGDVVEEPGLVSLPDGDSGSAEDAGHSFGFGEYVKHHCCNTK